MTSGSHTTSAASCSFPSAGKIISRVSFLSIFIHFSLLSLLPRMHLMTVCAQTEISPDEKFILHLKALEEVDNETADKIREILTSVTEGIDKNEVTPEMLRDASAALIRLDPKGRFKDIVQRSEDALRNDATRNIGSPNTTSDPYNLSGLINSILLSFIGLILLVSLYFQWCIVQLQGQTITGFSKSPTAILRTM